MEINMAKPYLEHYHF